MKFKKLRYPLPIKFLVPNLITIIGLTIGVSAIRFSLEEKWELAVGCVVIAALLDSIDGRIARLLNATSVFGAELDSLCDFANFGVTPGIITYLWSLQNFKYPLISWGTILIYIVCASIRLARFNVGIYDESSKNSKFTKFFFIGVPSTIGAILVLIPLICSFEIADNFAINIKENTISILLYVLLIGFLMSSRLPTISLKNIVIQPQYIWLMLFSSGMIVILAMLYPWYVIPILGILYLLSIPVSATIAKRIN